MKQKGLKEYLADEVENEKAPIISDVRVSDSARGLLTEGKWIKPHIRIDQLTHLKEEGQAHAHVYGRKGNEIVVVNLDGTASHGTKGRLSKADHLILKAQGFKVPDDRMVEWWVAEADDPNISLLFD